MAAVDLTNPQTWNRYAYVLNNPLTLIDPSGLECVWDDGSFDDEHDANTGSVGSCGDAGGTWVELGQNGNWSGQADPANAALVSSIQNGLVNSVMNIGADGQQYSTFYNSSGQAIETITPSGINFFGQQTGFTFQLGVAVNGTLWGFTGGFFAGVAVDSHGHVALYHGRGVGGGEGMGTSGGVQLAGSNGNSVCALGGPFTNMSGTAGYELAGTGDYFQGTGDGPGGVVQGGGVTIGVGGGGAASVQRTWTRVSPIGSSSCVKGEVQ